jgi:hypothetical protein
MLSSLTFISLFYSSDFQDLLTYYLDGEMKGPDEKMESVNYKNYSLCKRLKVDHPFRRRFIHTVWLFWAFVGLVSDVHVQ